MKIDDGWNDVDNDYYDLWFNNNRVATINVGAHVVDGAPVAYFKMLAEINDPYEKLEAKTLPEAKFEVVERLLVRKRTELTAFEAFAHDTLSRIYRGEQP